MTPQERAARIADARALLDILDADPSLPLPHELGHAGFFFRADGTPGTARRESYTTAVTGMATSRFHTRQPVRRTPLRAGTLSAAGERSATSW